MVIRLFFMRRAPDGRVRRLCLAARRAAWYNTCSFWKGGHGCLPFITLQGVCHVDKKTAAAALAALLGLCVLLAILVMACAPRTETADVAILMYHAFTEDEADTGSLCTPASEFARQLSALRDAGYTSVGYADLIEFVNGDGKLPEKPLLITIDDGYQNNLDLAAPLLENTAFAPTSP